MSDKNETFRFAYSAEQQNEVKQIREKYIPQEENKMEQLRRLDKSAVWKGTIWSILVGTISTLFFGVGMCCTMVWGDIMFVPGVVIGIIGLIGMVLAYPLYTHFTKKMREKLAPQIIKLTDELIQN